MRCQIIQRQKAAIGQAISSDSLADLAGIKDVAPALSDGAQRARQIGLAEALASLRDASVRREDGPGRRELLQQRAIERDGFGEFGADRVALFGVLDGGLKDLLPV